jgi:hypothetical protein
MTCPNHSSLLTLISITISGDLYIFCISRLLLILHIPCSHFGRLIPYAGEIIGDHQ